MGILGGVMEIVEMAMGMTAPRRRPPEP